VAFNALEYLRYFGFQRVMKRGINYMSSCPDFRDLHPRGDKRPSFGVHSVTGLSHCFACQQDLNLEQLTAGLLSRSLGRRVNEFESWRWLEERGWLPSAISASDVAQKISDLTKGEQQTLQVLDESILDEFINGVHPSIIFGRGITIPAAEEWELRYDKATKRTIIPVRNYMGLLVGVMSRSVDDTCFIKHAVGIPHTMKGEPNRFVFKKGLILYGEHKLKRKDTLLVTETPLDVVYCWGQGLQEQMDLGALFGSVASSSHLERMLTYHNVILALDNDDAGRVGTEAVVKVLQGKVNLRVFDHFGAKDLGEVDIGDLQGIKKASKSVVSNRFISIPLKLK